MHFYLNFLCDWTDVELYHSSEKDKVSLLCNKRYNYDEYWCNFPYILCLGFTEFLGSIVLQFSSNFENYWLLFLQIFFSVFILSLLSSWLQLNAFSSAWTFFRQFLNSTHLFPVFSHSFTMHWWYFYIVKMALMQSSVFLKLSHCALHV